MLIQGVSSGGVQLVLGGVKLVLGSIQLGLNLLLRGSELLLIGLDLFYSREDELESMGGVLLGLLKVADSPSLVPLDLGGLSLGLGEALDVGSECREGAFLPGSKGLVRFVG